MDPDDETMESNFCQRMFKSCDCSRFKPQFEGVAAFFFKIFLSETFSTKILDYPQRKISPNGAVSKEQIELEDGW